MTVSSDAMRNRKAWDSFSDDYQKQHGPQLNRKEFVWGVWSIPEAELQILGDIEGKDVLEIGCGAAQLSAAVKHLGGNPVGIDNSSKQLEHAKELISSHGFDFPLVHCSAEDLPFDDEKFDIVFCDHGAMSFSPTEPTLKEVSRVLKKGGLFAFNIESPVRAICDNWKTDKVEEKLNNEYFRFGRMVDPDDGTVYFQHTFGNWIRLFKDSGFRVVDLIEIQPPENATSTYDFIEVGWARKWPAENVWKVVKD